MTHESHVLERQHGFAAAPSPSSRVRRWGTQAVLALVLGAMLVGLGVRLYRLDRETITHPEFYVPGIPLPEYVHSPRERMTTEAVFVEALFDDVHPPGYYLFMLYWNRTFGTELFWLRLPSVIFGVLTIGVLFGLGRHTAGRPAALLATWMLALHGFHMLWSQQARDWVLVALLAVTATYWLHRALMSATQLPRHAYVATATLGMWVEYYFWPIFLAHLCWVLAQADRNESRAATLLRGQVLVGILSAPLLVFFVVQSARGSHLSGSTLPYVLQLLQFGGIVGMQRLRELLPDLAPVVAGGVAVVGALALSMGLLSGSRGSGSSHGATDGPSPMRGGALVGLVGAGLLSSTFSLVAYGESLAGRKMLWAAVAAPWFAIGAYALIRWRWSFVRALGRHRLVQTLLGDLLTVTTVFPLLALFVLNLRSAVIASYGLVVFTPFVLLLMARGITRFQTVWRLTVPALMVLCLGSMYLFGTVRLSQRNYRELADALRGRVQPGDVILVATNWWTDPIHYYLPPTQYSVMPPPGSDLPPGVSAPDEADLPDRVWVLDFGTPGLLEQRLTELAQAVPAHVERERISAYHAGAVLLERGNR